MKPLNSPINWASKLNKPAFDANALFQWVVILALVITLIAAMFNLRLGFGSHSIDCIDGYMHITRLEPPSSINRGDYIVFIAPEKMTKKFAGHLVIKKVGAVPGDKIRVEKGVLYINDVPYGSLDIADKAAKIMKVTVESFERNEVVPNDYILAVGTKAHSFDGRYWGFVPVENVVGSDYTVF